MADATRLLSGLRAYRDSLDRHARSLQREYQQLNGRWRALQRVYEGRAAKEFHAHWGRTDQVFSDYLAASQRVRRLLDERISALERLDRPGTL